MRVPDPKANTTTEAYLAYKAGFLEESELKPVLYEPYLHFDAWLAYWAGLTSDYPHQIGKNLCNLGTQTITGFELFELGEPLEIGTYTFSAQVTSDDTGSTKCFVRFMNGSTTGVGAARIDRSSGRTSITITTTGITDHIYLYAGYDAAGSSGDTATFTNIQIEKGSTATEYEPYAIIPEMLTDEEALVAYLSGVTSEYPEALKDPADVRVASYLKYLISARWGRPEYPVNNEEFYLSTMKPPVVPSGDTPSSDIEMDDTAEAPFIDLKMYGDTSQTTYSGKNLIPNAPAATIVAAGITWTITETTISGSGTIAGSPSVFYRQQTFAFDLQSGTYTFSIPAALDYAVKIDFRDSDGVNHSVGTIPIGSTSVTFTTDFVAHAYAISITQLTTGDTFNYSFANQFQLEAGSTATDYEPYVGGIPAPSPDYPQEIQTVTGEQTVSVSGKNLFNTDNPFDTSSSTTVIGSNSIYLEKPDTRTAMFLIRPRLPAGTYTVSYDVAKGPTNTEGCRSNVSQINGSTTTIIASSTVYDGAVSYTFTATDEVDRIYFFIAGGQPDGATATVTNIQIERGSTATDFVPYQTPQSYPISLGSTQLCKIGDYQDYIYRDEDGDWYVHKAIEKYIFNGSENWTTETYGTNSWRVGVISIYDFDASEVNTICDFAKGVSLDARTQGDSTNTCVCYTNLSSTLVVRNTTMTTKEAMQTATAGKRLFYKATPTDTQITNSELISQLDALMEGGSYEGKTYIKVTATDPNLPGLLYVEAGKYD